MVQCVNSKLTNSMGVCSEVGCACHYLYWQNYILTFQCKTMKVLLEHQNHITLKCMPQIARLLPKSLPGGLGDMHFENVGSKMQTDFQDFVFANFWNIF